MAKKEFVEKEKKAKKKNTKKKNTNGNSIFSFRGRQFRNGSYSAVMIVIALAIVIVLNLIVSKLPTKYTELDISSNKLYTVGEETKKLLKNLDTDVDIYYLISEAKAEYYPEITKLVEQYEELSDHVTLSLRDPDLYPTFGDQYDAVETTVMVVASDKRYKLIDFDELFTITNQEDYYYYGASAEYEFGGENALANAVNYVVTDNLPKVYNLTGNDEVELDSSIETVLTDANVTVEDLNLLSEDQVPDDCDCLMIIAPETDLSEKETKAILSYLKDGGNAMIFSNYQGDDMSLPNFNSIVEAYGVQFEKGVVLEADSSYMYGGNVSYVLPEMVSTEITSDLVSAKTACLIPTAQGIKQMENNRDTLEIMNLLKSSESSYLKENAYAASDSGSLSKEDGDAEGPFALGVAISDSEDNVEEDSESTADTEETEDTEKDSKETKLVVFGSSAIVDGEIYSQVTQGNAKLFAAAMGWMCDSQDSFAIAAKSVTTETITVDDQSSIIWTVVYLAAIPIVIIGIGIVVVVRRRNR